MGRILVIRGGALGDFILTLPAIRLLREGYPDNHLEILGYRPIIDIALDAGLADATRSIEYGPMAGFFAPGSDLPEDLVDYFSSFDIVISHLYDPDGFLRGNLERAGVGTLLEGIYKIDEASDEHAARQLARPLEQLALFLDDSAARIPQLDEPRGRRIAIHPGSGSPRKNWPLDRWAALAESILDGIPEAEFLVVTGEAEAGLSFDDWSVPFERAHALPYPDLLVEMSRCSLYLGHDSGVSHLASAAGLPAILLFGPTNPDLWAPTNPKCNVIRAPAGRLENLAPEAVLAQVKEHFETV